jgi:hypothetical protein
MQIIYKYFIYNEFFHIIDNVNLSKNSSLFIFATSYWEAHYSI